MSDYRDFVPRSHGEGHYLNCSYPPFCDCEVVEERMQQARQATGGRWPTTDKEKP